MKSHFESLLKGKQIVDGKTYDIYRYISLVPVRARLVDISHNWKSCLHFSPCYSLHLTISIFTHFRLEN